MDKILRNNISPSNESFLQQVLLLIYKPALANIMCCCRYVSSCEVTLPMELLQLEQTLCEPPQVHNRQKIIKQVGSGHAAHRYLEGYSMLLSDLLVFATLHHFTVSVMLVFAGTDEYGQNV